MYDNWHFLNNKNADTLADFFLLFRKKIKNFHEKWAIRHFFVCLISREKNIIQGISPKSGPNAYFLSVLIVRRKIFSTFFLNYEPNAIFLYSLIVEAKKISAKSGPFGSKLYALRIERKSRQKWTRLCFPTGKLT